jgi:hypothetical protein
LNVLSKNELISIIVTRASVRSRSITFPFWYIAILLTLSIWVVEIVYCHADLVKNTGVEGIFFNKLRSRPH